MKVTNGPIVGLTERLDSKLQAYRDARAFEPNPYVEAKAGLINEYFLRNGLDTAVIGLSGGIDSAVAYGLLHTAKALPDSPLKKIVPLLVPAHGEVGATRQDEGERLAREVCTKYGEEPFVLASFGPLVASMTKILEKSLNLPADDWARGQITSYGRTPLFYGATSLLTSAGLRPLLVGTTNLTEGGYLGFIGKASDAMTDLQVISDLHKSEVYAIAETLGLPAGVRSAVPTGDMFDGRPDEALFGATYDFVELYYHWLQDGCPSEYLFDPTFMEGRANLEKLHSHNAHKYRSGFPSVFLDLYSCDIPGGWKHEVWR